MVSMVQQTAGSSGKVGGVWCVRVWCGAGGVWCGVGGEGACLAQITLEFFERKKGRWLMPAETVNWEVWHLALTLVEPASELGVPPPPLLSLPLPLPYLPSHPPPPHM